MAVCNQEHQLTSWRCSPKLTSISQQTFPVRPTLFSPGERSLPSIWWWIEFLPIFSWRHRTFQICGVRWNSTRGWVLFHENQTTAGLEKSQLLECKVATRLMIKSCWDFMLIFMLKTRSNYDSDEIRRQRQWDIHILFAQPFFGSYLKSNCLSAGLFSSNFLFSRNSSW